MSLAAKPRRIGAMILVLNEEDYIGAVLESIRIRADRVLVMLNTGNPWYGDKPEPDRTEAVVRNFQEKYPHIELIRGEWSNEADQRNEAMERLKDCEYVYVIDGDEILTSDTFLNLTNSMMQLAPATKAWYINNYTFWKTPEFRIDPPEGFKPLILAHQSVRFANMRAIEDGIPGFLLPLDKGVNHHFSYAHSDEKIKQKLDNFSHADEIIPGWYENVWKMWDAETEMENLHPTLPQAYQKAVHHPMHREVAQLLKFNEELLRSL